MNATNNYFAELADIDVSQHIEKKGQFSYLSWPFAVQQLRLFDETATWEVIRHNGLPFLETEQGFFVEVAVTVKGVTLSQIHPVLDGRNKPLLAPNAFDINTSIQRCLVKAIALHGLGLSVYAGEDLPSGDSESQDTSPRYPKTASTLVTSLRTQPNRTNGFSETLLLTQNQLRYIRRLIDETDTKEDQLLGFFGFDALENIPKQDVNRVIRMLENKRNQEAA